MATCKPHFSSTSFTIQIVFALLLGLLQNNSMAQINLIKNGDFSLSQTGDTKSPYFNTEYVYYSDSPKGMIDEGTFVIADNPKSYHHSFCDMQTEEERSPGSAVGSRNKMLIGNAAKDASKKLWAQTLTVLPYTNYTFTFWASSLAKGGSGGNNLLFGVYANCKRTGSDIATTSNCNWVKFTFQFNTGNLSSIDLSIRNLSVQASGNDIAIDDISFVSTLTTTPFPAIYDFVWRGYTNDWFQADNWGSCSVPTCADDILIPGGLTKYPVLTAKEMSVVSVGKITIKPGASLTIDKNTNLTVCGEVINDNTIIVNGESTVTFNGALTNNGTLTTNKGATITMNSTVTNNGTLTTNKESTVTFTKQVTNNKSVTTNDGSTVTFKNNFSNAANATLSINSVVTFSANFTNNGTQTNSTTSTVVFNGQQDQAVIGGAFVNVQVNLGSGKFLIASSQVTVSGILTLTQGLIKTNLYEINVTNNSPAAIVGHSAKSYIQGNLRRAVTGTGNYDFPVGDATRYELIRMSITTALGGNTTNVLGFFNSGNVTGTAGLDQLFENGYTFSELSTGGYWHLTPNALPTSAARYNLEVFPVNITAKGPAVTLVKRPNAQSNWSFDNSSPVTGNQNSRTGFRTFSEIALASGAPTKLPVELLSFDASPSDEQTVHLKWITANEQNSRHFIVEKSQDALHFTPIATIKAAGNSKKILTYDYSDKAAVEGNNYYRLTQVDMDGTQALSKVIAAMITEQKTVFFSLYPNPVSSGPIYLSTNYPGEATITITNQYGIIVDSRHLRPSNNQVLDTAQLDRGIYIVSITTPERVYQQKLSVK